MPTKQVFKFVLISSVVTLCTHSQTYAATKCEDATYFKDNFDECTKVINNYTNKLAKIRSQQTTIDAQIKDYLAKLNVTDAQIESLKKDIAKVSAELKIIEENLANRRGSLGNKTQVRNTIVRDFYKFGQPTILEVLLSGGSTWSGGQAFAVRDIFEDTVGREAVKSIISLNMEIADFESDKKEAGDLRAGLELSQNKLLSLKADIDRKKAQAVSTVAELDKKGDSYEKTIAELSAKQQQILAEKSGSDSRSVGDYDSPKVSLPSPKFSPAYVAISYGAFTHYKGMSQFGARGRAEAGQGYKAILKFYYNTGTKKADVSKISVSGVGNMDMQRYLYGIAEMHDSWPRDALMAQAVAARTYAYRYAKEGKTICTNEDCQVFLKSKSGNPPSAWKKAVDDTNGIILDGSVIAYYSSTTGGYIEGIGWDAPGGVSGWKEGKAYEHESPWFYKAWWTRSWRDLSTCGRSDPYLSQKEMADILNALTVWDKGGSSDRSKVSPVTTSCWGGSPYSLDDMKSRADDLGTAYSNVSSVSVEIGNNGRTTKVTFGTDKGSISVDGEKFRTVFNLRAPGYISIKDRLYEVVKK